MSKAKKYAFSWAVGGGVANSILNAILQLDEMGNNPEQKFDWGKFLTAAGKGVIFGAAGGAVVGSIIDKENNSIVKIATGPILQSYIERVQLNKEEKGYQQLSQKAEWLISKLKNKFSEELSTQPYRFGSTEMGTALHSNTDIDICLPLRSKFFTSIEDMFLTVERFLEKLVGINGIKRVRRQDKSIGVIFSVAGKEKKIDILPHSITNKRGNKYSGYLCVNETGFFNGPSRTKTNPYLLKNVRLRKVQKDILILLKDWKTNESIPISSHLLQYLILDAYSVNANCIPREFTKKVIMVLRHIAENICCAHIRGIENSNNILTDLPVKDKRLIAEECKKIVEEFEYQPNSIISLIKK